MSWKKFLTEKVLKECWHEWRKYPEVGLQAKCSCGILFDVTTYNRADILYKHKNRTFDNRDDMMDLYEVIEKDGKWSKYETFIHIIWMNDDKLLPGENIMDNYIKWLFCLSGKGYEDRCRMAAEFYGWKEADHD